MLGSFLENYASGSDCASSRPAGDRFTVFRRFAKHLFWSRPALRSTARLNFTVLRGMGRFLERWSASAESDSVGLCLSAVRLATRSFRCFAVSLAQASSTKAPANCSRTCSESGAEPQLLSTCSSVEDLAVNPVMVSCHAFHLQ